MQLATVRDAIHVHQIIKYINKIISFIGKNVFVCPTMHCIWSDVRRVKNKNVPHKSSFPILLFIVVFIVTFLLFST